MDLLFIIKDAFKVKFCKKPWAHFFDFWKIGNMLPVEGGLKMSLFTANKLRETRNRANFSQAEAATAMKMSERKLRLIEANEHPVSVDDILEFSKLYKVDVRELIIEFYQDFGEEQILCNRYASFLKLFDQLTDREKEDVIWVIKQRIAGRL